MNTSVLQLDPQTAELLYGTSSINVQVGLSGSLLILCGSQLMFFGFRCFRSTLAVVGFLTLGSLTWIGLVNNKPMDGYSRDAITMFIVPLCVGIVGAIVCCHFWKISVGLVAVLGGMTMAMYICCWKENLVIPSDQGRIGFFIGCPLLMLILSKWKEKLILHFSLAFSGSFTFILGIDLLAHTGYVTAYWHMLTPSHPSLFVITRLMYVMQCATLFVFVISFLWQIIVHYHDPPFGHQKPSSSSNSHHQHHRHHHLHDDDIDIEQQTEVTEIPRRQSSLMAPPLFMPTRPPPTISSVSVSPTPTHLDSNQQTPPASTTQLSIPVPSPLAHHPAASSISSSSPSSSSPPTSSSSLPNTPSSTHSLPSPPLPSSPEASSSEIPSSSDESLHHNPSSSSSPYPTRSAHTF